nr:hypothetical protein [uncultured Duganella sp.]
MAILHSLRKRLLRLACGGVLISCSTATAGPPAALSVQLPPALAQQAILFAVQHIPPQREEYRRYRMAWPFGAPLFPPDHDLALPPVAAPLAAWLALPAGQRRHDVLLTPDVDYYWTAEGRQFSCQFILHLEAQGAGTRLAILQVRPTEYAGKHFELLGRTGPGRYVKLLPTAPSPQAEGELRAFLATALAR